MQMFLNLMICCLLVQCQGVLGNEGCDNEMWSLIPKFLTDFIVQVLLRSTVIIVYEDSQKNYVSQVAAELHRNSLNPIIRSVAMDSPYNRNRTSRNLLRFLDTLTFNQSTLIYAVCVCFTSSVLELFLRFPAMQRHITGRILEAQGDFSANERWIFLGPNPNKNIFSNFTYKVAAANIKKLSDQSLEISISGNHFLSHDNRKSRLLAKWNTSGFGVPHHIGLMDTTDKYSLKGRQIRVAHLDVFPFFSRTLINAESSPKENQSCGMECQLISTIGEYYGFQLEFILAPDSEWGHRENTTWFGLVGMVHRQEADVAMTSFSQTFERLSVIDYSFPHFLDPVVFITESPKLRSRAFLIFKPFQIPVIASVLLTAFLTGCLLHTISKLTASIHGKRPKWGFFTSLWFILGSLTLRGDGFKESRESTIRILVSFWWIFTLVIMSAFAGVLISCLNVPRLEDAIDTIEKFSAAMNENKLFPSTLRSTSIYTNFQNAKEGLLSAIGEKMRQDPELAAKSLSSGLELTLSHRAAFIFPQVMTEGTAVTLGRDRFHFSDESFFLALYSIGMPKRSPLKSLFNPVIRKLTESGIIGRWLYLTLLKKQVVSETNLTSTSEKAKTKQLTWKEMQGTFLILGTGYMLSILAFIVEKVLHYKSR